MNQTPSLQYRVSSGKNTGEILTPHRYNDGFYQAHKTNSRNDPKGKRVKTMQELYALALKGYHIRMSNLDIGHAPSTVKPDGF